MLFVEYRCCLKGIGICIYQKSIYTKKVYIPKKYIPKKYIPKKYILTLICLQDDSSTPIYIGYINRVK
jgi:hypothetical protein